MDSRFCFSGLLEFNFSLGYKVLYGFIIIYFLIRCFFWGVVGFSLLENRLFFVLLFLVLWFYFSSEGSLVGLVVGF